MTYLNAVILGLVQGLTEFLPVSSSGHLAMLQYFFGIEGDSVLAFTIMLHVGTLISVFYMYWSDIIELIKELFLTIKDIFTGKGLRLNERPVRRLGVMMIVATIPTGIIGVLFNDAFESLYLSLFPIGVGLLLTGCLLWLAQESHGGKKDATNMTFLNALVIGTLQGVAICPGVSRSGSTLVGGLFSGLDKDFAVKFAFLISIPSILGSLVFELNDGGLVESLVAYPGQIFVGTFIAAVSGIFAIKLMIAVVRKYSLKIFSAYVWVVGLFLIIYSFIS